MRTGRAFLFALGILASAAPARAQELYGPEVGVVPFGMGRAYTAVADDWLALAYNPAGLALVKTVDVQPFEVEVGTDRGVVKGYQNVKNINNTSQGIAEVLSEVQGKNNQAQFANHSQITIPHFALAFNYDVHADVEIVNPSFPQTFTRYTKDFTISSGGAVSFGAHDDLRIGARLDFIHRIGGMRDLSIDEIAGSQGDIASKFSASGDGVGGTVGMQYRLPIPGKTEVTTSLVWYNIGVTAFGNRDAADRPTPIDQDLTAGLAVRIPIGQTVNRRLERRYGPQRSVSSLTFAFDYSQINYGPDREPPLKHVHLGMNLDLPLVALQVGLNQTSLTYGASVDLGLVKLAAATYAEEIGSYAGQERDRRYLLSVGSNFGFKGF